MLKIAPEFKNLIAPLSADEFNQLESNIIAEGGCRETIKTWRGYIIDGHNRYEICQKHGLPFKTQKIPLLSKTDVKVWIADNQLGRRNLSKAMRIEIAHKKAELLQLPYARKYISETANVSESTVQKYHKLIGKCSPEVMEQVRSGKIKIDAAYKNMCMETKTVTKVCSDEDVWQVNMLAYADRIKGVYNFFGAHVLSKVSGDEVDGICGRLGAQFDVLKIVIDTF